MTTGTTKLGMNLAADFAWMGFGVVRCKRSMIRSLRREIGRELAPVASRLVFINQRRLKLMRIVQAIAPGTKMLKEQIDRMDHLLDIVNGIPRGLELNLVYRYVPVPDTPPLDPARDGVGIMWYAPVLPMKTGLLIRMIDMIEKTLQKHGFEQAVSLTTIHEKCAIGVIPIIYRRPEEREKAQACFRDLWRQGNELGCHPYRMNVGEMASMTGRESTFWNLARELKAAVDPRNILSPGRYSPLISDPPETGV